MFNEEKIKQDIQKLAASIVRIEQKAMNEGRSLSREEVTLVSEMQGSIKELTLSLPEKPMTLQNGGLMGSGDNTSVKAPTGRDYRSLFGEKRLNDGGFQNFNEYLTVGTGGAPIQPAVLQNNGKFSLLGKEMLFTEKCPALGSLGQLMLVDLQRHFQLS